MVRPRQKKRKERNDRSCWLEDFGNIKRSFSDVGEKEKTRETKNKSEKDE